jgi:hypothetical protein
MLPSYGIYAQVYEAQNFVLLKIKSIWHFFEKLIPNSLRVVVHNFFPCFVSEKEEKQELFLSTFSFLFSSSFILPSILHKRN